MTKYQLHHWRLRNSEIFLLFHPNGNQTPLTINWFEDLVFEVNTETGEKTWMDMIGTIRLN